MSEKIKESSLLKSESEIIKNAGVRENTNTRIGGMFWRVVEYCRNLVNNLYIELDKKVTKDGNKQLSEEDFTTGYREKLDSLSAYQKPTSEPISYIEGLQTALDNKVSKSQIVQQIPDINKDVSVASITLLEAIVDELTTRNLTVVEVNRDNYSIKFKNHRNQDKQVVDLSFLLSGTFTLNYNAIDKTIELVNRNGEKSTIPVSNLLSNIPNKLQINNTFDIQLSTENDVISTISLQSLFTNKNLWDLAGEHQNIKDGSNPHKTTFDSLIDKPTTLAGYGITNAVTKDGDKQLSDENFTSVLKQKLDGLQNYTKPTSEPISYITGLQSQLTQIEQEINTLKQKSTTEVTLVTKKFAR